ncbi:MAG TPA: hypothetical protein VKD47_02440 [Miltoncostaeaceae bacterium]|nr:hypothetical protein [Miltoncostaeaceae bacterium]
MSHGHRHRHNKHHFKPMVPAVASPVANTSSNAPQVKPATTSDNKASMSSGK